jgi:hypothetical protein
LSDLLAEIAKRPMKNIGGVGGGVPTDTELRIARWNGGETVDVKVSFDLQAGSLDCGLAGRGRLKVTWDVVVDVDPERDWNKASLRQHLLEAVGPEFDRIPARVVELLSGWSLLRPGLGEGTGGG